MLPDMQSYSLYDLFMKMTKAEGMTLATALLEQRNARKEHAFLQADLLLEAEFEDTSLTGSNACRESLLE